MPVAAIISLAILYRKYTGARGNLGMVVVILRTSAAPGAAGRAVAGVERPRRRRGAVRVRQAVRREGHAAAHAVRAGDHHEPAVLRAASEKGVIRLAQTMQVAELACALLCKPPANVALKC